MLFTAVMVWMAAIARLTNAKVVVFFPAPHIGIVRTHINVGQAVAKLGHDVYVCVPQFMINEKTVELEGVNAIVYGNYLEDFEENIFGREAEEILSGESTNRLYLLFYVTRLMKEIVRNILTDEALVSELKSVRPNLFVFTHFAPLNNILVLPYMLDVPFAYLCPFNDLHAQRVPFSPAATPCQHGSFNDPQSSFLDRVKNTACHSFTVMLGAMAYDDSLVAEFAPLRPPVSLEELSRQAEIYIIESDAVLDFGKPSVPNTKLVGSTAPKPAKPLKEPFKTFVENSKNGVAVVTLGSSIVNIPDPMAQKMISAFLQQDLDIIWRANVTSPDTRKVMTSYWVPQNDILGHKNTKLFVSHCGSNGQYEALYHGVPILCLPLARDQFYNAHRSTVKGLGLQGQIFEMTDTELASLMQEVSSNPRYKNAMEEASKLFRELYKIPADSAAYWIDHVMTFGGAYMKCAGQVMPYYQFIMLDLMAAFLLASFLFVLAVYGACRLCCGLCCRRGGPEAQTKRSKND